MLLWVLVPAVAFSQDSEETVREGRALYESQQCWQCHGYEGQGSVAGVRIAPTLYPYEAFALLVRHTNLMPAYSPNVLSDPEATPGFVSLEGYLAGRLAIAALEGCGQEIDRACFLNSLRNADVIDIDGFELRYGQNDNQGSDTVFLTTIGSDGTYRSVKTLRD